MSDELEDKESKTEEPSQKKLEQALEKGQVSISKEVTNFLMILTLTLITILILPFTIENISLDLKKLIENSGDIILDPSQVSRIIVGRINNLIVYLSPIFIILITIIIFSYFIQHGQFIFSIEQISPKLSRLSIMQGINRIFSLKSFVEFIKNLIKIIAIGIVIYVIINKDIKNISLYQEFSTIEVIRQLSKVVTDILLTVCVMMFAIAGTDFFYQRYEYIKSLMMSKQELKEEYKQMEGSPEVKRRQRSIRMDRNRKQMMSNVPKADVIITNPEHYSIALQYDPSNMEAPMLVAKGLDNIALKIKEIAIENSIPIIENPPLARALYKVNLNQQIPLEHYEAVAKIISHVYKMKNKSSQ